MVLMARAPRLGCVKRRLAADLGAIEALRFHRGSIGLMLRRLRRGGLWRFWVALTPDNSIRRPLRWLAGSSFLRQGRGDLGARLSFILRDLPAGPIVIVGSDCVALQPRHIARGFSLLRAHDWVLGPAEDGGYWLIGASRRARWGVHPFTHVRWGGDGVLRETCRNLRGRRVAFLECLSDTDYLADFTRNGGFSPLSR